MISYGHFIGGKRVAGRGERFGEVYQPMTGEVRAKVAFATKAEVAAAVDALSDPAVRKQLENLGLEMPPADQLTPEALGAWQKAEIGKWWPIIKAANIKIE